MNRDGFRKAFPDLSGYLAGDFQYPDGRNDRQVAADMLSALPIRERREILVLLVRQANDLLEMIHEAWAPLASVANRGFRDESEAREWLSGVTGVWEEALAKLDGSKPA